MWLTIIFWLITHAPEIIALIKEFLKLINGGLSAEAVAALKSQLLDAKNSGDVLGAKKIIAKTCHDAGIPGCPLELVGG